MSPLTIKLLTGAGLLGLYYFSKPAAAAPPVGPGPAPGPLPAPGPGPNQDVPEPEPNDAIQGAYWPQHRPMMRGRRRYGFGWY